MFPSPPSAAAPPSHCESLAPSGLHETNPPVRIKLECRAIHRFPDDAGINKVNFDEPLQKEN